MSNEDKSILKNFLSSNNKYYVVMLICFIYAGAAFFSVGIRIASQAFISSPRNSFDSNFHGGDLNLIERDLNITPEQVALRDAQFDLRRVIFSVQLIIFVISGFVSLLAGISIFSLVRKREHKNIRTTITNSMLLPNEQRVINVLQKNGEDITQSKLVMESGLTKIQVHRALVKLEKINLIEKQRYGLTNKIMLKKEK